MRYFKIECKIGDQAIVERYREIKNNSVEAEGMVDDLRFMTGDFNGGEGNTEKVFISGIRGSRAVIGVTSESGEDVDRMAEKFSQKAGLSLKDCRITEILTKEMRSLAQTGMKNGFIDDIKDILPRAMDRFFTFGENLVGEDFRKEWSGNADRYFGFSNLREEIERIQAGDGRKHAGIPVHYIIRCGDKGDRKAVYRLLLSALHAEGRLPGRRYTYFCAEDIEDSSMIKRIYDSSSGCAVVAMFPVNQGKDAYAMQDGLQLTELCEIAGKYRKDVLTVICFGRDDTESVNVIGEKLRNMCFVEIADMPMSGETAFSYLKAAAREHKVRADRKLSEIAVEGMEYYANELDAAFENWYDLKLRTKIYPQYKELGKGVDRANDDNGKVRSASEELEKMIGLDEAKSVIRKAVSCHMARQLFADNGVKAGQVSLHMVFTGNPGTAKTTVARLFARILKEKRVLPSGHLVEVGRGDLVGEYVGQTAPKVVEKFHEAKGGVLFIDEAYSLVDDKDGLYGDEAINTIVQEMENHRNDTVVIFAGYPDRMGQFLRENPGLRSRIAFHVPFADYDGEELCRIAEMAAENEGLCLGKGVREKLYGIFEDARRNEDFGNGRFARNIIEQGKMSLAERIMGMDMTGLRKLDVCTLTADDITCPEINREKKQAIGFYTRTA